MFSGIVRDRAEIINVIESGVGREFVIELPPYLMKRLRKGDSVLLNGVCFTVHKLARRSVHFEAMPETLRHTTAGSWFKGTNLNAEPSLRLGDDVGGHLVYGHVDEIGELVKRTREGTATIMKFRVSDETAKMLAKRGSIAINGVSLTVTLIEDNQFKVSLLPDTIEATDLGGLSVGDNVNIEIDMLMRYAYKQLQRD
ncbi:MAG: riboflavin synthase [bacterium]|nr:riboflavin synthase [bacterium]